MLTLVAAAGVFCACDGWGDDSIQTPAAKYHYPSPCLGDKAVWWMDKEYLIDQEPVIKPYEIPGKVQYRYTCHLNFGKDRYKGIISYFQSITRSMYTLDEANSNATPSDWSDTSKNLPLKTCFIIRTDEHIVEGEPMYDTQYFISVSGDKEGDDYVLTIEYLYTHFS